MVRCHLEDVIECIHFTWCDIQSNGIRLIDRFGFPFRGHFFGWNAILGCDLSCWTVEAQNSNRLFNIQLWPIWHAPAITYHSALTKISIFDERWVRMCLFFCLPFSSTCANWHVKFVDNWNVQMEVRTHIQICSSQQLMSHQWRTNACYLLLIFISDSLLTLWWLRDLIMTFNWPSTYLLNDQNCSRRHGAADKTLNIQKGKERGQPFELKWFREENEN